MSSEMPTATDRETRILPIDGVEMRAVEGDPMRRTFTGYAAVFNQITDIGGFREQVAPGAFRKTLREARNVAFLWNHDENTVMASTQSGTLRLKEDRTGLRVEADLDLNDQDAKQLVVKMERGDVQHMSFAFSVVKDEWDEASAPPLRTLREVKLYDASAVLFPAYPQTSAEVRSRLSAMGIEPDTRAADPEETPEDAGLDLELSEDRGETTTAEVAEIPADILRDASPETLRAMFDALQALMARADQDDEPDAATPVEADGEPEADHSPSRSLSPDLARRQIAVRRRRIR